jgi:hypothetical protein
LGEAGNGNAGTAGAARHGRAGSGMAGGERLGRAWSGPGMDLQVRQRGARKSRARIGFAGAVGRGKVDLERQAWNGVARHDAARQRRRGGARWGNAGRGNACNVL